MSNLREDFGELYSQVNELYVDETKQKVSEVISVLIDEGYSDSAINCYFESQDDVNIVEKYTNISESYEIPEQNIDRVGSLYQEGWGGRLAKNLLKHGKTLAKGAKNFVTGGKKAAASAGDDVLKAATKKHKNVTQNADNAKWIGGQNPGGKPKVPSNDSIGKQLKDAGKSVKQGIKNNKASAIGSGIVGGGILAGLATGGEDANKKAMEKLKKDKAELDKKMSDAGSSTPKIETPKKPKSSVGTKAGLSLADAIKASKTDAGKDLVKSVTSTSPSPKKPSTASGKELPKAKEVKKGSAKANMIAKNKERFGGDKIDKLRSKNAAFQAAKKSGSNYSMDDFVKDFPNSNAAKDRKKSKRVTSVMDMESYEPYNIVLDYLLETNQVATVEEANYVMLEMDSKTIQDIVNNK